MCSGLDGIEAGVRLPGLPDHLRSRNPGSALQLAEKPFPDYASLRRGYSSRPAIARQFAARHSAVRHASAWAARVGLWAPLVPITEASRIPRFGTSVGKAPAVDRGGGRGCHPCGAAIRMGGGPGAGRAFIPRNRAAGKVRIVQVRRRRGPLPPGGTVDYAFG
jgi:hypothetical protein